MAVPFSNTHLRVPRGFGSILEGLAREVLRHQPEDIPTYAAVYFDGLLKEREESGLDPAEWAAKLEDRFYNNHAFKAIPPATDVTSYTEEKSKTENEESGQVSSPPTRQPDGVTGDVQESDDRGTVEKVNIQEALSPGESDDILPVAVVSNEDCGREEEDEDQTIFTTSDQVDQELIENDIQFSTDKDISHSELDNTSVLLSRSNSIGDLCAEELQAIEHNEKPPIQEQENTDNDEIRDTSDANQSTDAEEVKQEVPYSGLADVDVCDEELQHTDKANVVDDDLNARTTKEEEIPGGFLLYQNRTQTASPQDLEPQEKKTLENQELIETHPLDTHELVVSTEDAVDHMQEMENILDTDAAPQEEALVEINFDDVPEVHEIVETEDQQPGNECLVMEQSEQLPESQMHEDIIGARSGNGEDGAQNIDEPTSETDGQEKEVKAEREEMDDHEAADISMEIDTSDLALSNIGYEGGLNETILSSKPSAEMTNIEIKTTFDNDDETDNEDASEDQNRGNNDPETLKTYNETEDPSEDTVDDEKREISREVIEGLSQGLFSEMEEELPSEFDDGNAGIKSNESKLEKEQEEEAEVITVEENLVEMKEIALAPVEPQPEDTMEEIEDAVVMPQTTVAEDQAEELEIDDRGQGRSNAVGEGSIESYHLGAGRTHDDVNQRDQRPLETENDVVDPETKDEDKEGECSRPQEEEEDIMDIPLDDPEANKAAAKIQAGFRGHMTRKKMKPEEKAEGEEVSTGEALNNSQGGTETGGAGAVEGDDNTSVPEQ